MRDETDFKHTASESVTQPIIDQIQASINQINSKQFQILAIQRFKNTKSFVQYISQSEDFNYMLCTCSDRALRLYSFDLGQIQTYFDQLKESNPGEKKQPIPAFQRVIYLSNEIKDVINGRKWQNSAFIKLNKNIMISC